MPDSSHTKSSQLAEQFNRAIRAVEQATNLSVSVHCIAPPLTRQASFLVPDRKRIHTTSFCARIKRKQEVMCRICDSRRLYPALQEIRAPYARTCHAGADEVIAPIYLNQGLAGVIFLGQFRFFPEAKLDLPPVSVERLPFLLAQADMLASLVAQLARRITPRDPSDRVRHIESFIDGHLSLDPSVGDLATQLGLSVSRTSHLVKELTGLSFRQLKESRKLEVANDLLVHSDMQIADVAMRVGVNDSDYFSRYYRKKTGLTPTAYREQFRTASV